MSPMRSRQDAELVALQDTLYTSRNPTRRWLHCARRDWMVDAIRRVAAAQPQRQHALEVGPGSGVYLPVLASLYAQVTASDIEAAYIERAQRLARDHRNLACVIDDITRSQLPSASVDLILCSEVIEHIPDSVPALREMRRLLRPGGRLVLSTPQRYGILETVARVALAPGVIALTRRVYREPVLETGHINLLTEREVKRQLTDAGFRIDESHKSGLYLPLVAEFMDEPGLRFERWLEGKMQRTPLDHLLWTQYHIAAV